MMMILSCRSGTSRIWDMNDIRMLLLLLISEAHKMATNGSRDPKRDWLLLFNSSSNSEEKVQLGSAWVRYLPLQRSAMFRGTGSGKGPCLVHALPTWWGSQSLHECWMFLEDGGYFYDSVLCLQDQTRLWNPYFLFQDPQSLLSFLPKLPIKKIRYF